MTNQPTTRDQLIEQAAAGICDAFEAYAPVPAVLRSEAPNIARALADAGLLADPEHLDAIAHAVRLLREAGVNRGDGLPARVASLISERDALQARIDAALALIDKGLAVGPFLDPDETRAVRAALQGDQPAEPPGCCTACGGTGTVEPGYPCEDCYATGHCHLETVSCDGAESTGEAS